MSNWVGPMQVARQLEMMPAPFVRMRRLPCRVSLESAGALPLLDLMKLSGMVYAATVTHLVRDIMFRYCESVAEVPRVEDM